MAADRPAAMRSYFTHECNASWSLEGDVPEALCPNCDVLVLRRPRRPIGSAASVDCWPCGCVKSKTSHGAGWSDCGFSAETKAKWLAEARSAATDLYAAMVRYVIAHGARRQERVSGWWWDEKLEEDTTLGRAVEELLALDGVDLRVMLPDEPEDFWND